MRTHAAEIISIICAFCVMLIHPLVYQNYYFNINRFKLLVYLIGAFASLAVYIPFAVKRVNRRLGMNDFKVTDIGMMIFILTSIVSCVLSDEPFKALTGAGGRYNGLVLMLALASVYVCVSRGRFSARAAAYGLLISGALCSLLSIINFFGYDPLSFAVKLKNPDKHRFISTIGNIDFFGAFLCLYLPCAAVMSVTGGKATAAVSLPCLMLGAGAVIAARADAALIALPLACLAAVFAGLRSFKGVSRAFDVISAICAGLWLTGFLCTRLDYHLSVATHACRHIVNSPTAFLISSLAFAILAAAFMLFKSRQISETARICVIAVLALALVCSVGFAVYKFIYYTYIDTETELTGLMSVFRFNDIWGTYRGGVWTRCLKLFAESDLRVKLFGLGPDCLKQPLKLAYGKEIAAYSGLSFDNAHNEPIQYLLTLGITGLAGYLIFAFGALVSHAKRAKRDFGSAAMLAASCTYLLYSLVNVNQPITTPLLFMALSAGVCASANNE